MNASHSRTEWYDTDMYNEQNYMKFGVVTDENFHVFKEQRPIRNFRAIGAVVGAHDALKEESGAGVSILSALKVANDIINGK